MFAQEVDLTHFPDPHLLKKFVLILHLQDTAALADAQPLGIEVQRTPVDARRDEQTRLVFPFLDGPGISANSVSCSARVSASR